MLDKPGAKTAAKPTTQPAAKAPVGPKAKAKKPGPKAPTPKTAGAKKSRREDQDYNQDRLLDDDWTGNDPDSDAEDEEDEEAEDDRPTRRIRRSLRWPLLGAMAWFFLGLACAFAMPRLALGPPAVHALFGLVQFALTLGLIGWNLWIAAKLVGRTGRLHFALPFSLMQLLLFPLFFLQIGNILGAHHYEMDGAPTPLDWLVFSATHAFRAADLVDTLQAFGLRVQNIRHGSGLTTFFLLIFHLVLDIFVVVFLLRAWKRVWNYLNTPLDATPWDEPRPGMPKYEEEVVMEWRAARLRFTKGWFGLFGAYVIFFAMTVPLFRNWQPDEYFRWPLDNALRVVDIVDVMELWGLSVTRVEGWFEGFLAVLFRLLLAVVLLGALGTAFRYISIRWLNGFGLTEEALGALAEDDSEPELQDFAKRRLEELKRRHPDDDLIRRPTRWLTVEGWAGVAAAALLGGLAVAFLDDPARNAAYLAEVATTPEEPRYDRALRALQRLGRAAEVTVPTLAEALPKLPPLQQEQVIRALGSLGPSAMPALGRWSLSPNESVARAALESLGVVGPDAAPMLLAMLASPHPWVRQNADEKLQRLGPAGAQALLDHMTDTTMTPALRYLDRLDPHWAVRKSANKVAANVQRMTQNQRILRLPEAPASELCRAAKVLGDFGPFAAPAVHDLIALFDRKDFPVLAAERLQPFKSDVHADCVDALRRIGAPAVPDLLKHIPGNDRRKAQLCLVALQRMGVVAAPALPELRAARDKAPESLHRDIDACIAEISKQTR